MKHWLRHRLSQKFSFLPSPKNPFIQTKVDDQKIDRIIYEMIGDAVRLHAPLMMGRYGSTECQAMRSVLLYQKKFKTILMQHTMNYVYTLGFFQKHITHPTKQDKTKFLERFTETMIDATKNCDVFGTWNGSLSFEEFFIQNYTKKKSF